MKICLDLARPGPVSVLLRDVIQASAYAATEHDVYVYISIYIHTDTHTCMHTHMHTYVYIYIHIDIHV